MKKLPGPGRIIVEVFDTMAATMLQAGDDVLGESNGRRWCKRVESIQRYDDNASFIGAYFEDGQFASFHVDSLVKVRRLVEK